MTRFRLAALATTAAAALVPAAASANTYCVYAPGCSGTPEWSIQDAITASKGDTALARIELGEGTYSGNIVVGTHPAGLEIVGQGPDKTILEPMDTTQYAVELHGATLSQVELKLPGSGSPKGLLLADGASADHIRAVGLAPYAEAPVKIEGGGGHVTHSSIDAGQNPGIVVGDSNGAGDATITDSEIHGAPAITLSNAGHTLTVQRDRVVVTHDSSGGIRVAAGSAALEDALIDLRGHSSVTGLAAATGTAADATLVGRHVTVLADGTNTVGVMANSSGFYGTPAAKSAASLSDSVLDGVATRTVRVGTPATLALSRVDTWPAAPDKLNGGTLSDEGSLSADPLLGADLVPETGSPLIDAAAPVSAGESDTDLNGAPRTVDGDGNCDARPDIGALEAPAAACTPPAPNVQPEPPAHDATAPVVAKLRLVHRRTVRFTVSEAARVTVRIKRAHHKAIVVKRTVAAGQIKLKLKHALRHGRYAIRVTAVDAAGNRGIRAAKVRAA
jgi:hypothetical protein